MFSGVNACQKLVDFYSRLSSQIQAFLPDKVLIITMNNQVPPTPPINMTNTHQSMKKFLRCWQNLQINVCRLYYGANNVLRAKPTLISMRFLPLARHCLPMHSNGIKSFCLPLPPLRSKGVSGSGLCKAPWDNLIVLALYKLNWIELNWIGLC